MKPRLHHHICARPMVICWVLGTLILWILFTVVFGSNGTFHLLSFRLSTVLSLLLLYACLAGLGFFVGVIALHRPVFRTCTRINGGPYAVGDRVLILTGPNAGTTTTVYGFTHGQGSNLLPLVDLGAEAREKHLDICEDFTLLRVRE